MSADFGKYYLSARVYLDSWIQNVCNSIVEKIDDSKRFPLQQMPKLHQSILASAGELSKTNYYKRLDCAAQNYGDTSVLD